MRPLTIPGLMAAAALLIVAVLSPVRAEAQGLLERTGGWPFGRCEAVAVDSARSLAFVGSGGAVLVLDVSNPSNPVLVNQEIRTSGYVLDLAYDAARQRLFIAAGEGGMEIWNVASPATLQRLSVTEVYYFGAETPVESIEIGAKGDMAYVSCDWGYVHWIDVSNPAAPVDRGFSGIGGNPSRQISLSSDGAYAYAAGPYYQRFAILSDGSLHGSGSRSFHSCYGADGEGSVGFAGYSSSLYILDLGSPTFQTLSVVNTGGMIEIEVRGNLAYLVNGDGLRILDIAVPSSPVPVGALDAPGSAVGLEVHGTLAYVAGSGGLSIMDVSSPSAPSLLGQYATFGVVFDAAVRNGLAYLSASYDGMLIVDLTDLAGATLVGRYDTPGEARDVALAGDLAYVADWNGGLRIVRVANPAAPVEVGTLTGMNVWRVAVKGNHALIVEGEANQTYSLTSVDVSNPSAPVVVSTTPLSTEIPWELEIGKGHAFLAHYGDGLRIFDIANPAAPVEIASVSAPSVLDVCLAGDLAYVASSFWTGGLLVLDISDPASPKKVSLFNPSGWYHPSRVTVAGGYAYTSTIDDLQVIDVSNPAVPVLVEEHTFTQNPAELASAGQDLYVADFFAGLVAFRNREARAGLKRFPDELSASTGGTVDFRLSAGIVNAGRDYFLVAGMSGTDPGTHLPGGIATLPLNRDALTSYVLARLNQPPFHSFRGILSPGGTGGARFAWGGPLPPGVPVGTTIHFAYGLLGPADVVSDPVKITVVP